MNMMMSPVDLEIHLTLIANDSYYSSMRLQAPDDAAAAELLGATPVTISHETLLQASLDPRAYGQQLALMLFADPRMREGWAKARAFAHGRNAVLRVRLRFDLNAPSLHGVRWETLADPESGAPLALSEQILLSRYLDSASLQPVRQPKRPQLKAIVAVAGPRDLGRYNLAPIDTVAEAQQVLVSLGDIPVVLLNGAAGRPRASLATLSAAMRDGAHMLYLVCHGTTVDGEPYLWMEDDATGACERVPGRDLAARIERLGPDQRPLLVVLAACHGATGDAAGNALRAVGPLLAAAGVGAVVAMQGLLPFATAERLLPMLFRELRRDGQIDRALAAARAPLGPDEPWWSPALFLRLRDGRLWQMPETRAVIPPARIFLSYKRNTDFDEPLALRLDAALQRLGHRVFIDQRLTVGLNWATTIEREISASDAVVVLLSRESVGSEMVLKEVEHAQRCFERSGRARLLPVRVAYTERLPYRLGLILDPIQYALWRGPEDDMTLVAELSEALAHTAALPSPQLVSTEVTHPSALLAPLPYADPAFIESLNEPSGAVERDSAFYIERVGDTLLRRQLAKVGGTMTTIRAPRQCGKSSLLYGGLSQTGDRQRSVLIDLQSRDEATFASLDSLLRSIAATLVSRLRLDLAEVERGWQGSLGPSDKLTYLMEDYVLPAVGGSLTLAIDEVDRMLSAPYRDSFFGLLRSWFNGRTVNPLWKKLNTVLVISTEPYLLIRDVSMSPFNVGLSIQLEDFDEAQVRDLNLRYREPLRADQLPALLAFLGGHPYLTHKALYTLVTTPDLSWEAFTRLTLGERSPLGDHVRRYYWMLRDQPELRGALQTVIREGRCPDELAYERLVRAGLVKGVGPSRCAPRCQLYAELLRGER